MELAKSLHLNQEHFKSCLQGQESEQHVRSDVAYGQTLGVSGTPNFFIGRVVDDKIVDVKQISGAQDIAVFTQIIEQLLNEGRK